jgi:hypothetical protein
LYPWLVTICLNNHFKEEVWIGTCTVSWRFEKYIEKNRGYSPTDNIWENYV